MKSDFTRIVVVLDRSGSMASVREATVAGFNEFVRSQRKAPGTASMKLVQFDDVYETVFDKPLGEVPELTQNEFVPRGMTALLDAQGRTITDLGRELEAMAEEDRPGKVIVVTVTDGLENRSSDYTVERVAALVNEQREKYGWDFVYLGANQDAVKVAAAMNIPGGSSLMFSSNPAAMGMTMRITSRHVTALRGAAVAGAARPAFSVEDRERAVGGTEAAPVAPLDGK